MKINLKSKIMPSIVLLVCLSLSGCMAMMAPMMAGHAGHDKAEEESGDTFWKQIKTADTPKKHLSMAKAYRQDAEDYRLIAKDHQRRKAIYQSYKDKTGIYRMSDDSVEFMTIHCQRLVEKFTELAEEMESMARKHEETAEKLAGQVKHEE